MPVQNSPKPARAEAKPLRDPQMIAISLTVVLLFSAAFFGLI